MWGELLSIVVISVGKELAELCVMCGNEDLAAPHEWRGWSNSPALFHSESVRFQSRGSFLTEASLSMSHVNTSITGMFP